MAYTYILRFHIKPEQMSELEIGDSLERVLGYLRTLLPNQDGFITSRALYSLEQDDKVELLFESVWDNWENIQTHRDSALSEEKVLIEFGPHIGREDLDIDLYEEVE
jgi:heme-degrading monooxygenase HmoA